MDNYTVRLYACAYCDLDEFYEYIANNLSEPQIASNIIDAPEEAIYSLESLPERGAIRRVGTYANGDYRQRL